MTLIVPLAPELIPSLVEMVQMQQQWHHVFDPRLPVQAEQEIASRLSLEIGSGLVALCDEEEVCGYGHPGICQEEGLLSPFLSGQIGQIRQLTLHPQRDTQEPATALLFALSQMWHFKFQSREARPDLLAGV